MLFRSNSALITKYPEVTIVEWEKEGAFYVADCYIKGIETEVWFTPDTKWVKTEFDLTYDMLPAPVLEKLTSLGYGRVNIDDIDFIYVLNKQEFYKVEIDRKGKDLIIYLDTLGEILPARP